MLQDTWSDCEKRAEIIVLGPCRTKANSNISNSWRWSHQTNMFEPIGRAFFSFATCDRWILSPLSHLFELLPVTSSKLRVTRIWIKTPLMLLVTRTVLKKKKKKKNFFPPQISRPPQGGGGGGGGQKAKMSKCMRKKEPYLSDKNSQKIPVLKYLWNKN